MNNVDVQEMLTKFKRATMFLAEVYQIDANFLDMVDLESIETVANELQIPITGFNLEMYENNTTMQYFIFEIWKQEAEIAAEVTETVIQNYWEENL